MFQRRLRSESYFLKSISNVAFRIMDDVSTGGNVSGTKCREAALYWASGCGHADCIQIAEGDIFPNCQTCDKPISWFKRGDKKPAAYSISN